MEEDGDCTYLNYLMEENVDGLPVLGLLVHGLLAQPQQARARQRQELLHQCYLASLLFSVADPDPGSDAFSTFGSGIRYWWKINIRIRMNIIFPRERAKKQFFGLEILKFFYADPESFWPWLEKFESEINIPDPQHCFYCKFLHLSSFADAFILCRQGSSITNKIQTQISRFKMPAFCRKHLWIWNFFIYSIQQSLCS